MQQLIFHFPVNLPMCSRILDSGTPNYLTMLLNFLSHHLAHLIVLLGQLSRVLPNAQPADPISMAS